ncbi:MAG: glycosyltransferase 87 family protein [Saprospiraceae bacterium]
MKPSLTILSGFALVLVPFWAQCAGYIFPAPLFATVYMAGLVVWALGYYQQIKRGSAAELKLAFWIGLALFAAMPPLISRDFYVYILQGQLALDGLLTYTDASVNTMHPFFAMTDPHWQDCPNQYGPVPLAFFKAVAWLGGEHILADLIWMKIGMACWAIAIFFLVKYIARAIDLDEVLAQSVLCLNPIFLLQGIGQMHIDLLSCLLICIFILAIVQNRLWLSGVSIGLMGATKFMLFPLFGGLLVVYAIYSRKNNGLKFSQLAFALLCSVAVLCLTYWPIWEGLDTIRIPMAYHEIKEPVKSVTELLAYLFAYLWPQTGPSLGAVDPLLQDKIYWGLKIKPFFQIIALLLAAWMSYFVVSAKDNKQFFYGAFRIILLVFILYSPVMHAWYLLTMLPLFAVAASKREVVLYAVTTLFIANTYEIGLTVGTDLGRIIMILFTVISVLSYFLFFRKFYFEDLR